MAWGLVTAGVAAPIVRKRLVAAGAAPAVPQALAFAAPLALCVAVPRTRVRDVLTCSLQMWAYLAAYKTPHDDEAGQAHRVHLDYPIAGDSLLGLGEIPTLRLQRALAPRRGERWRLHDRVLVWTHWVWFVVPHGTVAYLLFVHPGRFVRGAVLMYAVFDIGASVYWVAPTAPPWYAGALGRGDAAVGRETTRPSDTVRAEEVATVRRLMVEFGEDFWGERWDDLYSLLGGNPLAAMPSLHFATSVMAASLLAETGPAAGAIGWGYATLLGVALVYLGEHYVVDLAGGAALAALVRAAEPATAPAVIAFGRAVAALEQRARPRLGGACA